MARENFTQRYLRSVAPPPAGGRTVVWDSQVKGLGLRVMPSGAKRFIVQRRAGGRLWRVTLGRWDDGAWPEMTIDAARTAALAVLARLSRGEPPTEPPAEPPPPPGATMTDLWDVYLDRHARPRKRTVRCDEMAWRLYLKDSLAGRALTDIGRGELAALHVVLWRERGAASANRAIALVSVMFALAQDWGLFSGDNPARRIAKAPVEARQRAVERHEFPAFLRAVHAHPNESPRDALLLMLCTGMRRGDVLAMRWDDLNLDESRWLIPRTKSGHSHSCPLIPVAAEIVAARRAREDLALRLDDEREPSPWVFRGRTADVHLLSVTHAWRAIKAEAVKSCPSLADLRVHDLRRTMASWQARTGVSLAITSASLAHRNLETTRKVYAVIDIEPRRAAMDGAVRSMEQMAGMKINPGDFKHEEVKPGGEAESA